MDAGTSTGDAGACPRRRGGLGDGRAEVGRGSDAGERAVGGGEIEMMSGKPRRRIRRGGKRGSVRVNAVAGVRGVGCVAWRLRGLGRVPVRELDPGAGLRLRVSMPVVNVWHRDLHPPQEHPQGGEQRAQPEHAPKPAARHGAPPAAPTSPLTRHEPSRSASRMGALRTSFALRASGRACGIVSGSASRWIEQS
jgi:hypothetical protein